MAIYTVGGQIVGASGNITGTPRLDLAPRAGVAANGGDQSFGQGGTAGFTSYTGSGPGTAAYTAMQFLGSYEIVIALGGSYESWPASNRVKSNLVSAVKAFGPGVYPNLKNRYRTPYVFPYGILESSQNAGSGLPYQTLANLIAANNWWVYTTPGGSTKLGSGFFQVNYTHAWGTSAGAAARDAPICGNVYGTLSNGQGPAATGGTYFASALLTTNVLDSRFTGLNPNNAAPNADGLFLDNCFTFPGLGLTSNTASWDGIGTQNNTAQAAYPSGASSLLSRGQYWVFTTMQNYLEACNPGSRYLNFGNFGNYFDTVGYGAPNSYTASAMAGMFHGGLVETAFGTGSDAFQAFQTFADMLLEYNATMDFCLAPKLVCIGIRLPATDGSQTATWTLSGTPTTVTTGTAQEYQCMRAGLCFTLLDDGYAGFIVSGNQWNLTKYYDELGDDSLVQVNVRKGWMGSRVGARPTAAAFGNGVWAAVFTHGIALFNPWGNGSQTLTLAQVQAVFPGNYTCISGSQAPTVNTGSTFVSFTFGDPDGICLIKS